VKRSALALVLALALSVLVACGGGDDARPTPSSSADRAQAAQAFAKAYTRFRNDFAAATVHADEDGLPNATKSVRAVRAAYFDLDTAARKITMPAEVRNDVNAMLGAIGELIAALDKQATAGTTEEFEAANPASSSALKEADDAIQVVVDALGAGTDDPGAVMNGSTKQRKLDTDYLSGGTVSDAGAWVADLLVVGADNVNHETPAEDMGVVVAWRAAFPEVLTESRVVGYERKAPVNGISGFAVLTKNAKDEASRSNPYYLAFAVEDASGACAGGVLSGYPDPDRGRVVKLRSGRPCSGQAVAAAAGY
jgi:hypothetical protein